jgi:ADP-L-glycero-D-manno-heptose 6-epimerase
MGMILVTGGAGFIGSNLVAGLVADGREVAVCDRFGSGEKWKNVAKHELADIVAPEELGDFLELHADELDAIVHMGAISATTERDVDRIVENNFRLSLDLWSWCAEHEVRFLYASSAATYGDGTQGFVDDDSLAGLAKLRPLNAYGWSKHAFDRRVARLLAEGRPKPPQWVGLKFFNVYGPNEQHKGDMQSVVAKIYPRAKAGEPAVLFRSHHPQYQDGGQLRDFVYVKDGVEVVRWLLANPRVNGLFNLGTGKARSFADLAKAVFAALDKPAQISFVDTPVEIRDKYQYFTQASMEKLKKAGYTRPFTSLEDGVRDYVQRHLAAADPFA